MDQAPVRQGHELVHHLLEISIARIEGREDTLRLSLRPDGADALLRSEDWSPVSSSRSRVEITEVAQHFRIVDREVPSAAFAHPNGRLHQVEAMLAKERFRVGQLS